ncbi:TRAP transporter permease, partial [Candidatus Omnitrophota bacterium]
IMGTVGGGPAKVAVVSSALMGMMTGSPTANIITTGSFTIPAMKRLGYPSHYAAAIEACASTGGVLMPPVMGVTAFVIAGWLDIPYFHVAVAATVPSVLYYLSLFVQIDGQAVKAGLKGLPRHELPSIGYAIREVMIYAVAIAVLIYLLLYLRREGQAPFYTAAFLIAIAMIRKKTRLGLRDFIDLFQRAGAVFAEITTLLISISLIMGAIMITGLGTTLSVVLLDMATGNVFLLVALAALASFIIGMVGSSTICYIILAILVAPALVAGGLDTLAVHLFLMYCGVLSAITPPVCVSAYVAASLAIAPPLKTGWAAMRLGSTLFLLPFFFIFKPEFILHGTPLSIAHVVGTGIAGVILLASGIEGYLVGVGRLSLAPRFITLICGALLFAPLWYLGVIAAIIFAIFITVSGLAHRSRFKRETETVI